MQLNATNVHDVNLLQDKAPLLVETLLESRQKDRGLAFNDVVTMVAVLEQMMFDESVTLLQAAYRLNSLSVEQQLDEDMLHRVLQSYLILFGQGSKANLFDVDRHQAFLQARSHMEIKQFEHDTVLNFEYARRHSTNPFRSRRYSFDSAAEMMENLAMQYGKWQNSECRDMKAHLAELDPEGLGVVPLGLFYAQPEGSSYHFSESADYLRQIGALDESTPNSPKVFTANYIGGPSNCIASSSYYSVCCISECDDILGEVERHISAPAASPERLLTVVNKVADTVLPQGLDAKLHAIAARHGGEVPLYGRLFAQWLHFAFPHECPFPSVLESATALTASQWLDGAYKASTEERKQHLASESAMAQPSSQAFDIDGRWSDHEVLPVHEKAHNTMSENAAGVMRTLVQIVALCVAVRSGLVAWRAATTMGDAKTKDAKAKDEDLMAVGRLNV